MTTDRIAIPPRGIAPADRAALGGRTQAPPTDAFSALLGAVPAKSDAPRGRDRPDSRDGKPRWDDGPRQPERHAPLPAHDKHRRPDTSAPDEPASDPIATSCDPDAPATETEEPVTAVTPSLFALQLASPLPPAGTVPAPAAVAATPVTPGVPAAAAPPTGEPVLPILPSIVPASVATATATMPIMGEVAAATPEPAAAAPAAVAASALAAVLAEAAPADGEVKLPENLLKPQAPAAAPQDAATTAQPQTAADAGTSGQSDTPSPFATPTPPAAAAAATQPKVAEAPAEPASSAAAAPVTPTPTSADVRSVANGLPRVERAVPLSRAVATTGVLLHLASERGVTHARLNLKPVELGGIEVKLHSTPAGIHAQLIADSPEAARMLSQAGDDLRRQLEDRDVNLLSLDVSTSSDQRNDQPGFSADGFGDDYRPGGYPSSYRGSHEDTVLMESPAAADTVLVLPDGVHVDVLA